MTFLRTLAALACSAALAQPALADSYPSKPITIVIGSSAGSTTDGLARAIGQEITAATKQPVIVESKAGAGGGIAAQAVARARRPTATRSSSPPTPRRPPTRTCSASWPTTR
jgi:tripartite-type tricarboxylate transporter receptor subunit TctC